jgi:hypothetical protein
MTTVFDHIERLKTEYTDKYVIVDETRPELRRFAGMTGSVKTVNMSGRALVQFDAPSFEGWIDIDVDFLKVVDEPLPQPEKEAPAKKPAAKKPAAKKPAAKPADTAKKAAPKAGGSVEDILAAARAGGSPNAESKPALAKSDAAEKPAAKMSVEEMLAAARGNKSAEAKAETKSEAPAKAAPAPAPSPSQKAPAAAAKSPASMSVEEILAAARAGKATAPAEEPVAEELAAEEPAAEEPVAESAPPAGDLPTETDDILAYCRAND